MLAVEVKNLSFAYPNKDPLLREIDFSVEGGQVFVLAGLSGCGKTTLCHVLSGVIPNAIKGSLTGTVSICGASLEGKTVAEIGTKVGLVFQDVDNQIVATTVEDELAFGLENLCVPPEEMRRRVDDALEHYGISHLRHQDPARLSGGQKRLVAMAAVLILEPELLILDEPMSNLDADGRAMVKQSIDALQQMGKTIVIVEHDLSLVTYADRWLILQDGRIAALDTPEELLSDPQLLRELDLLV